MRRRKAVMFVSLFAALAVQSPASATVSGNVTFTCTAQFPKWPGEGFGLCGGTPSLGYVSIAGTDDVGFAYTVEGLGAFSAQFQYAVPCLAGQPLLGNAVGEAVVQDVPAIRGGAPRMADVEATFQWARIGGSAVVTVTGWTVTFSDGGVARGTTGVGTAAFAPVLSAGNLCPFGAPLTALVLGEVEAII